MGHSGTRSRSGTINSDVAAMSIVELPASADAMLNQTERSGSSGDKLRSFLSFIIPLCLLGQYSTHRYSLIPVIDVLLRVQFGLYTSRCNVRQARPSRSAQNFLMNSKSKWASESRDLLHIYTVFHSSAIILSASSRPS